MINLFLPARRSIPPCAIPKGARLLWCSLVLAACATPPLVTEKKVVGDWSWTYIEGIGRITLTADHKVIEAFPVEDENGRPTQKERFEVYRAGTWRLERNVLITKVNNRPLLKTLERLTPWEVPPLRTWVDRRRIVKIDEITMVSDDGRVLTRVHR
jgi:hypothetical protein